jgi:hypothetical protein
MKFDILNRWTGSVVFTAEIECSEDASQSIKLGLAIRVAVKARARLAGAYRVGANLADAYLEHAYLAGAALAGANLTGANLAGANLAGAYLEHANLTGANLEHAYLAGANLAGAYLEHANLTGANLAGAYLTGANLTGAKWRDDITINHAPLQLYGLGYPVTILDDCIQIGCELHTIAEWSAFDDRRIIEMDGATAAKFWKAHKDAILALAASYSRGVKMEDAA